MRKGLFLIFVVLLLSSVVSAKDLVSLEEVNSTSIIEPKEVATFVFTLSNNDAKRLQLQLGGDKYAGTPSSEFEYVFVDPNYVALDGHDSVEVTVLAKPKIDLKTGRRYKTSFFIKSLDDSGIDLVQNLEVLLKEPTSPITMELSDVPELVAPGSNLVLDVGLINNVPEDLSNIDIYVTSDLFEEKSTVQLFKDQERNVEFVIPVSEQAAPMDYTLNVRMYYNDDLQATEKATFTVELSTDVELRTKTVDGFMLL